MPCQINLLSEVIAVLLPGAFYMLKATRKPPVKNLIRLGVPMALAGATINGAKARGLHGRKGSLELDHRVETGKDADFVVWDIYAPTDLSYQVGLCLVNKIVIAGKIAYNV